MAVNLAPPDPAKLLPVAGVKLGFAEAGIRKAGRRDVMLMAFAPGTAVAGVFTQNAFAAAPVQICREQLSTGNPVRGLIVNAGNANCGTGASGLLAARECCAATAAALKCEPSEILPFSTGVILEKLPAEKIAAALPRCLNSLSETHWAEAASAIMTTDTVPKATSRAIALDDRQVVVTGIAKGVGMLQPNMATMLAYVATDAAVEPALLRQLVREVADCSFNRVTVDGDTSTNDSFVLIATGASGIRPISSRADPRCLALLDAITQVAVELAMAIARDGEGATKFISVKVAGGKTDQEVLDVARSIANSPLVKTAFFASDPNLGRLIMAVGNAGIPSLDISRIDIFLGDVNVIDGGERAKSYREEDGAREMQAKEIELRVELGRGTAETTVWTCDYSYDYVKINAEYRT